MENPGTITELQFPLMMDPPTHTPPPFFFFLLDAFIFAVDKQEV